MKEKILDTLHELGFSTTEKNFGYEFEYEGITYVWMPSDDEAFLSIAVPAIIDAKGDEELAVLRLMEDINSTVKYVKANMCGNSLWLYYERELIGEEKVLPLLLSRMICSLFLATEVLRQAMDLVWEEQEEDQYEDEPSNNE